jgi:hypothetical protein
MNPLLSYTRHCIVVAVFYIVEKYDLPIEGSTEAIEWIALTVVTSLAWAITKYSKPIIDKMKSGVGLLIVSALISLGFVSCSNAPLPFSIGIKMQDGLEAEYSAKGGIKFFVDPNSSK